MKLLPLLLLLPLSLQAQLGQPGSPQRSYTYDAAGNRVLRQAQQGGASTQSAGTGVRMASPAAPVLGVSPNPAGGRFVIDLVPAPGPATLEVYDLQGRLLLHRSTDTWPYKLDLRDQPAGIYLLHIRSGGLVWEEKLLKRG